MCFDLTKKEKLQFRAVDLVLGQILKYIDKQPEKNLLKLVGAAEKLAGNLFPAKNFDAFRKAIHDPENIWTGYVLSILRDMDRSALRKGIMAMGYGTYVGTKTVRANREKYKCNFPYILLFDPTSACNRKCKGCWSAEYGSKYSLTLEEMQSIVNQGTELGSHLYMMTGGEPLIRKKDILTLCEAHPDCMFLCYTNATLIDEDFCREMNRVGNLSLALSIEGSEESNDFRRGEGSYATTMRAMDLLKKHRCFFGMSVCYTSANIDMVTSDAFIDQMIEKGVKFGLYFNYMPIGANAVPELIPSPAQREHMYKWLRRMRNSKSGKPMFVMDFQNDAEYVGGCIAGGRNYFHINSAGDIEPCVFIHYSDANIRTHTLLEALHSPLFQAFFHNQPFNDNHLRPCPMLENPQYLRKMVDETGAKSTDFLSPESADTLCSRCDKFANAWAPEAERIWNSSKHPKTKTFYYRDTPEGKAQEKSS